MRMWKIRIVDPVREIDEYYVHDEKLVEELAWVDYWILNEEKVKVGVIERNDYDNYLIATRVVIPCGG